MTTLPVHRVGSGLEAARTLDERLDAPDRGLPEEVVERVRSIGRAVRDGGDEQLLAYVRELDGGTPATLGLRVGSEAIDEAAARAPAGVHDALARAADRIRRYHEVEKEAYGRVAVSLEGFVLTRWRAAVERAGIYVPGGTAAYPSTVLMTAIPARVAGVEEIACATPCGAEGLPPAVAAALQVADVDEVYAMGGAHAVAALAWGTETVDPVDEICGPGSVWVAAAKREVAGTVGVDGLAGPTEVCILADETADATHVARDLLAQAEHDERARPILLTDDEELARAAAEEVDRLLADLPRRDIARVALAERGGAFVCRDVAEGVSLANRMAPEHLQILCRDPEPLASLCRTAGAVFCGPWAPAAIGDYWAGPSHVLPTGGTARFASPLGVDTFLRASSVIGGTAEGLEQAADPVARLARAEGFEGHARSVLSRMPGGRAPAGPGEEGPLREEERLTCLLEAIRPEVREVAPYTLKLREAPVRLHRNESPFDVPDEVKDGILGRVRAMDWNRYPAFEPDRLKEAVAIHLDRDPAELSFGNGSNELLEALVRGLVPRGAPVVVQEPTFTLYGLLCRTAGNPLRSTRMREEDLAWDVDALREALADGRARLCILCSPNNPTGGILSPEAIEDLARAHPRTIFCVDEAYGEFASVSALPLAGRLPNVCVLRTFSKAFGLAALRVGYLVGHPRLTEELAKVKLPYNVDVCGQEAAIASLEEPDRVEDRADRVMAERDRIAEGLRAIDGVSVVPSGANFQIFRVEGREPGDVFDGLLERGVLVRDVSAYPLLGEYLRVTAGLPEENDRFLEALAEVAGTEGAP